MYYKFIKFVVLLSLLVCCGFAGRVLYSRLFNRVVQGKDPRHIFGKVSCLREQENRLSFKPLNFKRFVVQRADHNEHSASRRITTLRQQNKNKGSQELLRTENITDFEKDDIKDIRFFFV